MKKTKPKLRKKRAKKLPPVIFIPDESYTDGNGHLLVENSIFVVNAKVHADALYAIMTGKKKDESKR